MINLAAAAELPIHTFVDEPCVHVPTLDKAWEHAKQYLESLNEKTRMDLILTGGATCSADDPEHS